MTGRAGHGARLVTEDSRRPVTMTSSSTGDAVKDFFDQLAVQRWDDHRYYHHSRINQTLHLVSAMCFVIAYCVLFIDPPLAALLAWGISMTTRQAGHFFFEPKGYDRVNDASHEFKEEIKVGYNLRRKVVLMALWAAAPVLLWLDSSLFGLMTPRPGIEGWLRATGWVWLWLGVGGLLFRTLQLMLTRGVSTGLVWACKIVTDPVHDILLYHKAPLHLLRGELLDPMEHVQAERNALNGA
jgi:hypothetical protein